MPPRVLVVGSVNRLVHWTENVVEAFRQAGCEVDYCATNGTNAIDALHLRLWRKATGGDAAVIARRLRLKVEKFQPDLVVFVLGAWLEERVFEAVREASPRATRVAWVGDLFDGACDAFARHVDRVFCTDSYFLDRLVELGHAVPASYLPLAMDPRHFHPMDLPRNDSIVYVARNSPSRAELVSQVRLPLTLYGKRWRDSLDEFKGCPHVIEPRHLPLASLPGVYAGCRAVLNIKNEIRVARGVNQRSFEPYGCMTPVLNDDVADLGLCFELDHEILVYRSLEELHEWHARLTADPSFARKIGLAGHRRVMAEQTYGHRARSMLTQLGLR